MELIKGNNEEKKTDNIQPQEKTNPKLDMDIVSQELSHFPNHVLCRALLCVGLLMQWILIEHLSLIQKQI